MEVIRLFRRVLLLAILALCLLFISYQVIRSLFLQTPVDGQKLYDSIKQIEHLIEHLIPHLVIAPIVGE